MEKPSKPDKELTRRNMEVGENVGKEPIPIVWANLKRADDQILYRSDCPVCIQGVLMVGRNRETGELEENDGCVFCGQQFRYTDIDAMRKMDHGLSPLILRDV